MKKNSVPGTYLQIFSVIEKLILIIGKFSVITSHHVLLVQLAPSMCVSCTYAKASAEFTPQQQNGSGKSNRKKFSLFSLSF